MAKLNEIAKNLNITQEKDNNVFYEKNKHLSTKKRRTWLENEIIESVSFINPNEIINWVYHDRPENELGDIKSLAEDFLTIGQQQPCIIRPTQVGNEFKYELIIGERRWRAAKYANLKLKVIIKEISDTEAALSQSAENDNRKDLSDYAKGMSYSKLIENKILTQNDIVEKLNRNRQYVSALLSYSKIPKQITNAIGEMKNVSYRTAETIYRLSQKGENYIDAIILKAEMIKQGKIGHNKLAEYVNNKIQSSVKPKTNHKIISTSGRHLFTWRKNDNALSSIHFPKNISNLLNSNNINQNEFIGKIITIIEKELKNIEN